MLNKKRFWAVILVVVMISVLVAGCSGSNAPAQAGESKAQEKTQRTYYYVGVNHGHPYWYDVHQGLEFAAEKLGCKIVKAGPDNWDPKAQAEALEQTITKKPDGIIVPVFDASMLPGIKKAKENGIPVIVIEATLSEAEALCYIGLDNYQSGIETAKQLIAFGGNAGKVVVMGNWGASNTDQKLRGLEDYLKANSQWEVIAKLDDKAVTESAIEAAKTAFNNYKNLNAVVGLDSSSGAGIGAAMEELKIDPKNVTVVVHDREDTTLEYIKKGFINATLINKTASQAYQAALMLEAYNNMGGKDIPLSADNAKAGVNPIPEVMYNGSVVITKDTVDGFIHANMKKIDSPLYN